MNMSDDSYSDFKEWHATQLNKPWDFKREFIGYCEADALLLAQGCLKFREIVLAATDGDRTPAHQDSYH